VAKLLIPIEAESAVLGVLSVTNAAFGIYAHTILAEKAGYTPEQVKSMLAGTCPSDITARQGAIYKLAIKLAQTRGPLDSESYDEAFSVLGHAGITGAINQAAAFMFVSLLLNAGDVQMPAGAKS
jgi:4-carboxymuconolactone decarboxylase